MLTKKLLITLILIFSVIFTGNLLAEDDSDQEKTSIGDFIQEDQFEQLQDLERLTSPEMLFASDFNDFPMYDEDLYKIKHHSTGKAFMLSLILPGSGQVYSGSKLKAAFFFGVEIFSWYQYIKSYNKGQDLEDEYRAFADQNWDPGQYRAWLIEEIGISNDTMPYAADSTFTHHLPDKKTQQYYEMIGKYNQFQYGWLDTEYAVNDSLSDYRQSYLSMRDESNSKFDAARNYAIVSIANRLVSAFEAALATRKLNKRADKFSQIKVKARLANYYGERIPKVTFTYKFF